MTRKNEYHQSEPHIVKLNRDKHAGLAFIGCENCLKTCCNGTYTNAHVFLNELQQVAKHFPVIFYKDGNGQMKLVFFFSIKKGVPCLYFNKESQKCLIHPDRPPVCRNYPFYFLPVLNKRGFGLEIHVDLLCNGLQESSEGMMALDNKGRLSKEVLTEFIDPNVLKNMKKRFQDTHAFLKLVEKMKLLVTEEVILSENEEPAGDSKSQEVKLYILRIDEQKLQSLDRGLLSELYASGYMKFIRAHIDSLANFQKLFQALP